MFLFIQPTQFNIQNVYFLEKKINMIMDGFFTKFVLSFSFMTMNGLFLTLPSITTRLNFLNIDTIINKDWIHRICSIEKQLLHYYQSFNNLSKTPVYTLKSQLQKGILKYYRDVHPRSTNSIYYLKISGIWENPIEFGLTFKIIEHGRI
jgi:hypothetical protein